MECPSCQATIPEGGKFCMECGTPLPRRCHACAHPIPAGAKFCPECGTSLVGGRANAGPNRTTAPKPQPPSPAAPLSSAERRQLTVMFCDLVGSTALSARLDPEDMRQVIGTYHKCVAEVVGHFDGFIARYMGDGVLVYFGWPQAREDDAERAVRAGLELVAAVPSLKPRSDTHLQ